jgi:uncharacterized protein DUF6457
VDPWLTDAADTLAREAGVPRELLKLDDQSIATLLDLARIAAHESGERTNAPLLCYVLGLSAGGAKGLEELADAVRRSSS